MKTNKKQGRILFITAIILIAALLAGYTTLVYQTEYKKCFEREATTLSGYHKDVCSNLSRKTAFKSELNRLIQQQYYIEMRIAMTNLLQLTPEALSELQTDLESYTVDIDFYQLDKKRNTVYESAKKPLSLSGDALAQLTEEGTASDSGRSYISQKVDDGYYVMAIDTDSGILTALDYDLTKLVSYVVLDNTTGDILESRQVQTEVDLDALSRSDVKDTLSVAGGIQIYRIDCENDRYLAAKSIMTVDGSDVTVWTFKDDGNYLRKAVYNTAGASILSLLFTCSCAYMLFRLRKQQTSTSGEAALQIQQADGKNHRRQILKTVTATAVSYILVSTLLVSIQFVLQISGEIKTSFTNLYLLNEDYENNQENVYRSAREAGIKYLDNMAEALHYRYEVDTDEWLKEMAEIIDVDEISLYDQNGVVVSSTTPYKGYALSTRETDPEYQLWDILKGSSRHLIFYSEEEQRSYLAVRRSDDVGLLVLTSSETLSPLMENMEFADLFTLQDYSDGSRLYYKQVEGETLYLLESGSSIAKTVTEVLPVTDSETAVIGMCNISGQHYLYINSGDMDWIFVFAYPVSELVKSALMFAAVSVAAYLLIAAILLFLSEKTAPCAGQISEGADSAGITITADFYEERKNIFRLVHSALAITSAVILLLSGIVCTDSLDLFEFFDYWEKGFNFISLTFILFSASICIGIVQLIIFLNGMICKILSPKWKTIYCLLTNLSIAVLVILFLIMTLEQLGVNAVAITTSLGLTGLALSIGSKDVISDLVAGLFIAFEGQIQLGDFVEINGFFGEIVSLGIRTAKIRRYNKEMIVNNTEIKNVLNHSRGSSCVYTTVVLPFDTNIDTLNRLITESEQRLRQACNGNLTGKIIPYGVTDVKEHGMEYAVLAFTTAERKQSCSVKFRTELIKLLTENGIEPAIHL